MKLALRLILACIAVVGCLKGRAEPLPPVALPGPAHAGGRPDAAARNAACEACHADVARTWRGSLHQRAYLDRSFAEALSREPAPFCRGCHAPEADPAAPAPPALAELGVGCVSCHLSGEVVLAVPRDDLSRETAPHALHRDPRFATAAACGGCHEFAFPDALPGSEPMQRTLAEHRLSARAATPCADCHMPRTRGRRDHGFIASRDPAMLRRSLTVAATRTAGGYATLRLTPGAVGHAVPTGDLLRRLVVVAEAQDGARRIVAEASKVLGRRFVQHERRVPIGDDRVGAHGPAPVTVELALGPDADLHPIRWQVFHERIASIAADGRAEVEARTLIAEGELPPAHTAPEPPR